VAVRRGSFRRSQGSSLSRDWEDGVGGTARTQISASGAAFLGSGVAPTSLKLTLMRTRGFFDCFLNGAPTADGDGFHGAVGIGLVTRAAFDAGIASVPTPVTEMSWDGWLWHQVLSVHVGDISLAPTGTSFQRLDVDSKAMRKFDTDQILFAAIEVTEIGGATLDVFLDTRMLFQSARS